MTENYHKWFSQYINREFEMLVFGNAGIPVIFFPPAYDRYYSAKDYGVVNSLSSLIDQEVIKLYTPDNFDKDSWYNFSVHPSERVNAHKNFESLIIHDIIGFTKFETHHEKIIIAGSGFGGYQAMNFTLKYPDLVSAVVTLDAFFDIRQFIMGFYNDDCYFNNPPDYLPGLEDPWYLDHLRKIKIVMSCGFNNPALSENNQLSYLLKSKNIEHNFITRKQESGWFWWNLILPEYISSILSRPL